MKKQKYDVIFLLAQIILAIVFHLGLPFLEEYLIDLKKHNLMMRFNQEIRIEAHEKSKYIKILINNFESLKDKTILESDDLNELKEACKNIEPICKKIFLLYSYKLNIAVLGAILLPGFSYSLKFLFKKQFSNKLKKL